MDSIKAYILSHRLQPGDPLPTEAELCSYLGVSRSSVREALRKLEALDIIGVRQGRGTFVGKMSLQPLVNTLVLRNALENTDTERGRNALSDVVATRRALDRGIASELVAALAGTHNPELHDIVTQMEEKSARGERYLEEDIAFHSALLETVGNELLSQLTSAMWLVHQAIIPHLSAPTSPELLHTAHAHALMLDAAEAGDVEAYLEALEAHYAPLDKLVHEEPRAADEPEEAK
ncbi:GntR family transcriptional regulator [Arcanobacterium wilhelmae]|nr:GntR family transcriptional regulator [Arcanobacterium wilhelmae]WFN90156.1 GntR family transcriptional regulator [Arcanobacterium wilhelmae]